MPPIPPLIDECPHYRDFDIITHSLGGAVVAYWLAAFQAEARDTKAIHSVITIDSPVNGVDAWGEASAPQRVPSRPTLGSRDTIFGTTGKVAQDLNDANFGRIWRRAADKIDMRCIP
ncbi:MAG: hypothetical protein U1F42_11340 [Candidatus Competibacteraceae bacterium]